MFYVFVPIQRHFISSVPVVGFSWLADSKRLTVVTPTSVISDPDYRDSKASNVSVSKSKSHSVSVVSVTYTSSSSGVDG